MFDTNFLRNDMRESERAAQARHGTVRDFTADLDARVADEARARKWRGREFVRFVQRERTFGVELIHGLSALMERKACKLRMRR
jgi:hypothetical protein